MNNPIIDIFPNFTWITIMPMLMILLKTAINSFNMTTVEKSILTDFKQLGIYSSQVSLFSLASGIILFVILYLSGNLKQIGLLLGLFISVIIMLSIVIIVFSFVLTFTRILSVKVEFFIREKDTQLEWKIDRRVNKAKLLVSREVNIYKFLDAKYVMEQEIIRKPVEKKNYKIWGHDKIIGFGKKTYISLIISILLLQGLNLFLASTCENNWWVTLSFIISLIIYMFTLYIFIVLNNDKVIKKLKKSEDYIVL